MSLIKCLASTSLAAVTLPTLHSQPRCPGNIASLPFHLAQRSLIIVPVVVNHTGPYDFVVDTGTDFTTLDPLLATELHLKTQGSIGVDGVGFTGHASFAYLDLLEAGSHSVANHPIVVQDLEPLLTAAPLETADFHFRGTLGGDFLRHFDVLMDYAHRMLCLDDTKARAPGCGLERLRRFRKFTHARHCAASTAARGRYARASLHRHRAHNAWRSLRE
jgi:Aspartyl protease